MFSETHTLVALVGYLQEQIIILKLESKNTVNRYKKTKVSTLLNAKIITTICFLCKFMLGKISEIYLSSYRFPCLVHVGEKREFLALNVPAIH